MFDEKQLLIELREEMSIIKNAIFSLPEWFSLSDIADDKGFSRQGLRQKLLSDFEPEVDYQYRGAKIYIARNAVSKIKRKRSNAKQ